MKAAAEMERDNEALRERLTRLSQTSLRIPGVVPDEVLSLRIYMAAHR